MTVNPSKDGKGNILVLTDAYSFKFSVAVITHNQHAKRVAKELVDKWLYTYGIQLRIHSNQGRSFDNNITEQLCKIYGITQSMPGLYNLCGNSPGQQFNHTLQNP